MTILIDTSDLRRHVTAMYEDVARDPAGDFHFETGRALAERLGYPPAWLDAVPPAALDSFAGVGYPLGLAGLAAGERVLDLGSGSGTDSFVAAALVGPEGRVVGVDMTPGQLAKARMLRDRHGLGHVSFTEGQVEDPPVEPESFDVVTSNGVMNLVPDKARAFAAAARALRPGGRLVIADIVSSLPIADRTRANTSLWAACIAGAATLAEHVDAITGAGLAVEDVREVPTYRFRSDRAATTAAKYGARSVLVRAVRPA